MNIFQDHQPHKNQKHEDLTKKTDNQLNTMAKKYVKGCNKIFHKPGYMNVKGDAPYDFTCDGSHRCQKCESSFRIITDETSRRARQKAQAENRSKTHKKLDSVRLQYFKGKPGCDCTKQKLCKDCIKVLQARVTQLEHGCGAEWEQQFGGMAAGPATVTCRDNYFLCDKCSEELAFISKINKAEFPNLELQHMPEIEKMFWAPRSRPYYSGNM